MSNVTTLAALREPTQHQNAMTAPSVQAGFFDLQSFELMQRVAKGFASSTLVPREYQGNVANTMIALSMAQRIGADPMMVMQNLYIVHGRPSWSSKFLIATFNACGRFTAMRFRFKGEEGKDDWACQAYATEKSTGEEISGSWVSIALAKAEGWYQKNGSKWKTMPQQMLMYRAASFCVNTNAPELSMGILTAEEAGDIIDVGPESYRVETLRDPAPQPSTIAHQGTTDPHPTAEDESEAPEWPRPDPETGELVDVRGVPWIEMAHSANRTCNDDGTWRRKRGADPERIAQLEADAVARRAPAAEPEPEPEPNSDFERIRDAIATAQSQDEIDDLWEESRQCVISHSERGALERIASERAAALQSAA